MATTGPAGMRDILISGLPCRLATRLERQFRVSKPPESPASDAQLVARIRAGDVHAEGELYERYCESVRMMLRHRTRKPEIADELCNDTFIIVLKKVRREGLEEPAQLSAFIHRTAQYVYLDWVRPNIHRREIEASDPDLLKRLHGSVSRPQDDEQAALASQAMIRLLANLAPRDRDVLDRFYLREQEKTRICEELGLSPANFDRVISRARNRLRDLLMRLNVNPLDLRRLGDVQ